MIKVDLKKVVMQREMNGTGSRLCPMMDFGINGVELLGSAAEICVDYKLWCSVTTGNLMLISVTVGCSRMALLHQVCPFSSRSDCLGDCKGRNDLIGSWLCYSHVCLILLTS